MIYSKFPAVDKHFLSALEERFPNECPPQGASIEEIYRLQGKVEVVAFLKHQFTLQNLNLLDTQP